MINSVLDQGLKGMQQSQRDMLQAADQIVKAKAPGPDGTTLGDGDLAAPIVELKRQEHIFNASAKIVSVADKTLGSLIDAVS